MNPILQCVLSGLIAAVLTGTGAYLTLGRQVLRREEARELVSMMAVSRDAAAAVCETHCPYLRDESALKIRLDALERKCDHIIALLEKRRPG